MKILIGLDSSRTSQYVVDEAVARPWPGATRFCVVHVLDTHHLAGSPALLEGAKREGAALVRAAVGELSRAGHDVISEIVLGSPRVGTSKQAKRWGADLIMIGSHGQGALARFLLGGVAQATLSTATCSIEIVRPSASGLPSSSHAMKILLATDGSEFSIAATRSIANRPWPARTRLRS